jgi:hypothetical protein
VIHAGHGDAFDTILLGTDAVGYEAATYQDSTRGFIATLQYLSGAPAPIPNSIHYIALWDSPTVPNFGHMLFQETPGHSITIQKYDGVNGGGPAAQDGIVQIRIVENDYGLNRFAVYNDGRLRMQSLNATVGDQFNPSPFLELFGARWNGAASVSCSAQLVLNQVSATAGNSELRINIGDSGSETLIAMFTGTGHASGACLDMQTHNVINVGGITFSGAASLDLQGGDITTVDDITFQGSSSLLDLQGGDISNVDDLTFLNSSSVIDMQGGDITAVDDLTFGGSGSVITMNSGTIVGCGGLTMATSVGNLDLQNGTISNSGNITMKAGGANLDLQAGAIQNVTSIDGSSYARMLGFAADGDPGAVASTLMITNATGVGDGAQTNLKAPAQGTGTGPASLDAVGWFKVYDGTNTRWVPMFA